MGCAQGLESKYIRFYIHDSSITFVVTTKIGIDIFIFLTNINTISCKYTVYSYELTERNKNIDSLENVKTMGVSRNNNNNDNNNKEIYILNK